MVSNRFFPPFPTSALCLLRSLLLNVFPISMFIVSIRG